MRGLKTERQCVYCKTNFLALLIRCRAGEGKFCSRKCYQLYRKDNATDIRVLQKRHQLKFRYNITEKQINEMLLEQNYKCKTCDKNIDEKYYVDHCHNSGKIRGLLCNSCNLVLGMVKDNVKTLQRMIDYLK